MSQFIFNSENYLDVGLLGISSKPVDFSEFQGMGLNDDALKQLFDVYLDAGSLSIPISSEEMAVGSARTCYAPKLVLPEDIHNNQALADKVLASTLKAGHLTTRQHEHFTFALKNVSRQFLWSFLHSHPYYNSEQVSQRYVTVNTGKMLVPNFGNGEMQGIYYDTIKMQADGYRRLAGLLKPAVTDAYFGRFPSREHVIQSNGGNAQKFSGDIKKRAQEVARYVLPVSTQAHLYHTVSALTLMRMHAACQQLDVPSESQLVVEKMVETVLRIDPSFAKELSKPLDISEFPDFENTVGREFDFPNAKASNRAFDYRLYGRNTLLTDWKQRGEFSMARAIRVALNNFELSDEDVIGLVLDPAKNKTLMSSLNLTSIQKLMHSLSHVHYSFDMKLSHTADSQEQRHRSISGTRPVLSRQYSGELDYITPALLRQSPEALQYYDDLMGRTFENINKLISMNAPAEFALYLLPNAFPIRFTEAGDLNGFLHKWRLRSCYNAQEEIYSSTIGQILQVSEKNPEIGKYLKAPCWYRKEAGVKPFCPEGDRYCGVPVWNFNSINEYDLRVI